MRGREWEYLGIIARKREPQHPKRAPPHLQRARIHGRNRAAGARDNHTVELGQVLNAHDAFGGIEKLELVVVGVIRVVGLHEALGKAHLGAQ
jgi:hypothetical protein